MSAEQGDRKPELREIMSGAVRTVSEQSSELMNRTVQALDDGGQVDVSSLIAAFDLNANLSLAVRQFLENRGQIIFPGEQAIKSPAIDNNENRDLGESVSPEGPKTFGELLRAKIDYELLPADKDSFFKSKIYEIAKDTSGVKKAALAEGIPATKRKITREETINILYRFFTTPPGTFKKKRELYSLQEIKVSFFPKNLDLPKQLSGEIGYDWTQNPTVDHQTAMELRGLLVLQKVLTGEKVKQKGHPGVQFTKRTVPAIIPEAQERTIFANQP